MNLGNNTIPTFPKFKQLTIEDKDIFKKYVCFEHPYSDYNFTSLFTWDIDNVIEISNVYDNLVVIFRDYTTREPFLSFLGKNNVYDTVRTLLAYAKEKGYAQELRLIPQECIDIVTQDHLFKKDFVVNEDLDSNDYILSTEKLSTMAGNKLRGKKNFVNRCKKIYQDAISIENIDITNERKQEEMLELFYRWQKNAQKEETQIRGELDAIKKLLAHAPSLSLQTIGIYIQQQLVAFAISEYTKYGYVINHYQKADITYVGIYPFLMQMMADSYKQDGYLYINFEQDLGIEGLRKSKLAYQPSYFLKKYTIVASTGIC